MSKIQILTLSTLIYFFMAKQKIYELLFSELETKVVVQVFLESEF